MSSFPRFPAPSGPPPPGALFIPTPSTPPTWAVGQPMPMPAPPSPVPSPTGMSFQYRQVSTVQYLGTQIFKGESAYHPHDPAQAHVRNCAAELQALEKKALIKKVAEICVALNALQIQDLNQAYATVHKSRQQLHNAVVEAAGKEIDGFEMATILLAKGPLEGDAWLLTLPGETLSTMPEKRLAFYIDLLIGRPDQEIEILRAYLKAHRLVDLDGVIHDKVGHLGLPKFGDTSIEDIFKAAVKAKVGPFDIAKDFADLEQELGGTVEPNQHLSSTLIELIVGRPPSHVKELAELYAQRPDGFSAKLPDVLATRLRSKNPTQRNYIAETLIYAVNRVCGLDGLEGSEVDSDRIFRTMDGRGTREDLLAARVVRAHWQKDRFRAIVIAYEQRRHKSLVDKMKSELKGFMDNAADALLYKTLKAIVDQC